ncbi:GABA-specific permease [Trichomonascus vanleenenianus]|uniref:GABA-specific permease n=1 Tax=Trichomonascus vanleenenianus TaxID=2268995 RepID=UPI003ECB7F73
MNDSKTVISSSVQEADFGLSPQVTKTVADADQQALENLGYKQEFKREFGFWSTFGVSFALLGLLPSIASTLYYGLGYAGTSSIWSWLIAMVGIQSVAMSMAELCSAMPTSGGLYYASAVLAPHGWGPAVSWLTGWSNWIVLVTSAPSVNYGLSSMILSLKKVHDPSYTAEPYQVFLLTSAFMIIQSFISSASTKSLAKFNLFGTVLNGCALFIALIVILAGNKREDPKFTPSKEVWGTIDNQTDWPDGIAILMSFTSIIWTMSGYDSPFHLAEECANANVNSPRAIVMTSLSGGLLGWVFQIAIAYTVTDVAAVIDSDLGQPFVTYLQQILPPKLVYFVTALTIVSAFFMGQAGMIAASRVAYAYSRDGCFPYSHIWASVNKYTQTPVNAVWINCTVGILILFLIFAGDVAIGAIFSVGAIAAYVAFAIPIAMKVVFAKQSFKPGPWNLGKFSRPIGLFSVAYVCVITPILCFPQYTGKDLTPDLMNWTVVVYFGPMFLAWAWYMIYARKFFKGPRVHFQHMIHDMDGLNVIMGEEDDSQVIEALPEKQ